MIILDTCALVWLVDSPSNLSGKAIDAIREHSSSLSVVPISAWEIAVKAATGRILMKKTMSPLRWYEESVEEFGLDEIHLDAGLLCASATLPLIHRDPCDRMIIAAAITHQCPVITADRIFKKYKDIRIVW